MQKIRTDLEISLLRAELGEVSREAGELSRSLRDLYNLVGRIPEVNKTFNSVYRIVQKYENI